MWLFLVFLAVPVIEIALFIQVGGAIGLWATLGIVVLTALIGTALVRSQGLQTLENLKRSMQTGQDPSRDMAHGAMILFSGALLLTPGFFTDAVGFALMVPAVRDAVFRRISHYVMMRVVPDPRSDPRAAQRPGAGSAGPQGRGPVIDGDYVEVDPETVEPRPGARPSGWTRGGE